MPAAAPSRSLTGALLALGGWAAFSLQDALVKSLVVDLPVPEVLFGRSLVIVCLTSLVVKRTDYRAMAEPRNAIAITLRSALILFAWLAYYRASRELQLADLATYYFAAPLFVVGISAPILHEYVGPGRWLATLLGFSGVLIAANPTVGAPLAPVGLALLAALSWAITTVLARGLSRGINTPSMMLGGAVGFVAACSAMLPVLGVWPSARQAALMGGVGIVGAIGNILVRGRSARTGLAARAVGIFAARLRDPLGLDIFWRFAPSAHAPRGFRHPGERTADDGDRDAALADRLTGLRSPLFGPPSRTKLWVCPEQRGALKVG